jgi:hypothetical protein
MMKLISGIFAVGFAYLPDLLILFGTFLLSVQLQLDRTPHVFAKLSPFILYITGN